LAQLFFREAFKQILRCFNCCAIYPFDWNPVLRSFCCGFRAAWRAVWLDFSTSYPQLLRSMMRMHADLDFRRVAAMLFARA